jgi:succinate-semialdehyde dehydrogenase / glutarate-semialdehyde dehydrogenase
MAPTAESATRELVIENPATGEPVGRLPIASADDVAAAIARARAAQPAWEAGGVRQRRSLLTRFHDLLFDRRDEILDTIQRESGKTRREALGELLTVAGTARYYVTHGEGHLAAEEHAGALRLMTSARVLHKPHGVVGFITPWNYPFILSIADALPALLAGNAVVVKPSELTPLSAELGRELLIRCGLDANLFQLVHGTGAVGEALIVGVDYIGFTGSAATGRKVAAAAAARLIPSSLELGGKNPMLVLDGAPLDEAVDGLLGGAFYNTGQTCIAIERAYIARQLFDRFVGLAKKRTESLAIGWSLGWDMDMGCLISRSHADKVMAHIDDARAKGATVVTGGFRRDDLGPTFVAPTLLTGVEDSMEMCCEETFGPVVALYPVDSTDEAIGRANDSAYGLNASVWSKDSATSQAVAERLDAGSVGINSTLLIYASFAVPMGGVKQSGIGRRHGRPGILRFTRTSSIVQSITQGGGYEALLTKVTSESRARKLAGAFKLLRRIPGC